MHVALYNSIRDGSLRLGTWTFPDKFGDMPLSVSVGKSKTDTFDNVMANMNLIMRFNLIEVKDDKKSTACSERPHEPGTEALDAESESSM